MRGISKKSILTAAVAWLATWTAGACFDFSSLQSSPSADASDATTDAATDAPLDGAPPAVTDAGDGGCALEKPFGAAVALNALNDGLSAQRSARLTHDELRIYFDRLSLVDGSSERDLWTATRGSRTDSFGVPVPVTSLNTAQNDQDPSPTGDGSALFFASDRAGTTGVLDLWKAIDNGDASFGLVVNIGSLNTNSAEYAPYVMPDGGTIYFGSYQHQFSDGGGPLEDQLYRAGSSGGTYTLDTSGLFDVVDIDGNLSVVATLDELTIYFSSFRTAGVGNIDVWKATRSTTSGPFGSVTNVSEVNTMQDDVATWISDDGCRLYLSRGSTGGEYNLYVAERPAN